jgi:hypothetical protein
MELFYEMDNIRFDERKLEEYRICSNLIKLSLIVL